MNFSCNLCRFKKFNFISNKVRDSNSFKIYQCASCSHIQIFPIPKYDQTRIFYDKDMMSKNIKFHSIKNMIEKKQKDTLQHISFTRKIAKKKSKILEIGSGYGLFLNEMTKLGYDITGIEISKTRRDFAEKYANTKVLNVDITQNSRLNSDYDLIVMFQVLQYISNPIKLLQKINRLLKKNGKLMFLVPNADDLFLKIDSNYKNWFWQMAHVNYFTPKILKKILKSENFTNIEILGVQRYSIENLFNWRLNGKPLLIKPSFDLPLEYNFLEKYYKNYLQKNLISDTLLVTAQKTSSSK